MAFMVTGPWKGVSGAGRARRGLSVIIAQEIDVHVHAIEGAEGTSPKGQNACFRR
jgi:hypothetical protein